MTDDDKKDDLLLKEFFEDIEKLTIHDDTIDDEKKKVPPLNDDDRDDNKKANHKNRGKERSEMLNRAEARQTSWQEFSIPTTSSNPTNDNDEERPRISFSLSTTKKKKKKPIETPTTEIKRQAPPPLPEQTPSWIIVLDTCAWIESYNCTCQILSMVAAQQQQRNNHRFGVIEPISVIIPYILWSELEYQLKQTEDEGLRYKARRAVRRLNEELVKQPKDDDEHEYRRSIIRSQSRQEMEQAASRHFFRNDNINNDDHILVCAQEEQRRQDQDDRNSWVVLLTLDNVLSGKSRANGITVYTPVDFIKYYERRMVSLRERAANRN